MAHFLRMMRCGNGLLLLRAAVAAKFCCVGEFFSDLFQSNMEYFLMRECVKDGARLRERAALAG